ncbi:MAG: amidohydrolase [Blautia sp.]|nr:amidohydrolase [Blautia sp.]
MREEGTMDILIRFLRRHTSFEIKRKKNWFYAVRQGRDQARRIAFRADMDALPIEEAPGLPYASCREGVSHKCGHDGHCAVLCGLALELDSMETGKTVYLIFQPGEETGEGAVICKEIIREEGIQEIYAFHNLPGYQEGAVVYRQGLTQPASEGLKITLTGKASHASAPEEGCNPAVALSRTVLFSSDLAGRPSEEMRLCTVTGMRLGTGDFGISPGTGEVCFTLRAEREADMDSLEKEIVSYAAAQAREFGLTMETSLHDRFPETHNHDVSLSHVLEAAAGLHLATLPMPKLWRASEDFGYYLKECEGAMFYIGAGEDWPALHTVNYDFNDNIIEEAVDLFCALVQEQP